MRAGVIRAALAGGSLLALAAVGAGAADAPAPGPTGLPTGLRPPAAFAGIADPGQRAVALFREAGRVIRGPRCVNCHPAGDRPLQGDDGHPHEPWVRRGADGHGVAGLRCTTCHHDANFAPAGVPGHPHWGLAPRSMAWQGQSLGAICRQIKDPARNGGRSVAAVVDHMAGDSLVGWAWAPGGGRSPAVGTQAELGALLHAWQDAGAACPPG